VRHSVLNAEAFTAILFLLIFFLRLRPAVRSLPELAISDRWFALGLACISLLAFVPALGMPLLHDSYGHVYFANHSSLPSVLRVFTAHPQHGDFFFRPLGNLSFWMDAKWAGVSPFRWHSWSVLLHVLNTLLVFVLFRQLSLPKLGAFVGALFFALHGSRPEAVAWVAARFDLLAAFFALLTLLCCLCYLERGNRMWLGAVIAFTTAALLSKESAYSLPFFALTILFFRGKSSRALELVAILLLNCGAVFAYRAWVLRGIGGYGAESGSPAILHFSLIRTLNALFFRQWALLFFPVNWSVRPGPILWVGFSLFVAALLITLVWGRGSRLRLALALAMIFGASLPVQHMLLIGSDASGVRVLYLPVLGLALFWALIVTGLPDKRLQLAVGGLPLLFQLAVLEHNLQIWKAAARLSQQACSFVANELAEESSPVTVTNLPATWNGVYFLKNSFEACVLLNSNGKLHQPPAIPSTPTGVGRVYRWSDAANRIVPVQADARRP
jgi:Dolichyl-phosphate-mannose-protein mannosyltransferase